jgi:hypothetical protein
MTRPRNLTVWILVWTLPAHSGPVHTTETEGFLHPNALRPKALHQRCSVRLILVDIGLAGGVSYGRTSGPTIGDFASERPKSTAGDEETAVRYGTKVAVGPLAGALSAERWPSAEIAPDVRHQDPMPPGGGFAPGPDRPRCRAVGAPMGMGGGSAISAVGAT